MNILKLNYVFNIQKSFNNDKKKFQNIKIASRTLKFDFDLAKEIISLNKNTFISLGMENVLPFKK